MCAHAMPAHPADAIKNLELLELGWGSERRPQTRSSSSSWELVRKAEPGQNRVESSRMGLRGNKTPVVCVHL